MARFQHQYHNQETQDNYKTPKHIQLDDEEPFKDTISCIETKTENTHLHIIASSWDKTIKYYELNNEYKTLVKKQYKHSFPILHCIFVSIEKIVFGDAEGNIIVWDIQTETQTQLFQFKSAVSCMKYIEYEHGIFATSLKGEIILINISTMKMKYSSFDFPIHSFVVQSDIIFLNCVFETKKFDIKKGQFVEVQGDLRWKFNVINEGRNPGQIFYEEEVSHVCECMASFGNFLFKCYNSGFVQKFSLFDSFSSDVQETKCQSIDIEGNKNISFPISCCDVKKNRFIVGGGIGKIEIFDYVKHSDLLCEFSVDSLFPNTSISALKLIDNGNNGFNESYGIVYGCGYEWGKGIEGVSQRQPTHLCLVVIEKEKSK